MSLQACCCHGIITVSFSGFLGVSYLNFDQLCMKPTICSFYFFFSLIILILNVTTIIGVIQVWDSWRGYS